MGWLEMLMGAALRKLKDEGEEELADQVVDDHRAVIVEAYGAARADGATEEEACLAACRRMITHAL